MKYNGLKFSWEDEAFMAEILIAFIAGLGFESFEEGEKELTAYIQTDTFNQPELDDLLSKSDLKFESEKWLEWSDKICDLSLEFFEM